MYDSRALLLPIVIPPARIHHLARQQAMHCASYDVQLFAHSLTSP
jgi:hypothetical protein